MNRAIEMMVPCRHEDSDEDAEETLQSTEPPEPMEPLRHTELAELPGGLFCFKSAWLLTRLDGK